MTVAYASPDSFASVLAVYVCACGRTETRYGRAVEAPPAGWVALPREAGADYLCPACAAASSAPS